MRPRRRWFRLPAALPATPGPGGCSAADDDVGLDSGAETDGSDGDGIAEDDTEDAAADVPECPDGETWCGAGCFDLMVAPDHCGTCDSLCSTLDVCARGVCAPACSAGTLDCNVEG
jgi:hypothetical protein